MRDVDDVYVTNPDHGAGVTAADLAELQRRRDAENAAALPNLGSIAHHPDRRVQCDRCGGRVYTFATSNDGLRHYCRTCVRAMLEGSTADAACTRTGADCILRPGHPGRCRDRRGRAIPIRAARP